MADAPSGRTIRMAISAPVLARLGNWAMDKGKLPARFDRTGKAQNDGDFEAGLQWNKGERPLKVNLWTIKPVQSTICMAALVGAEPKVAFQKGQLSVGFEDGKIEEVIGPPLFSNVLDIMGIT